MNSSIDAILLPMERFSRPRWSVGAVANLSLAVGLRLSIEFFDHTGLNTSEDTIVNVAAKLAELVAL